MATAGVINGTALLLYIDGTAVSYTTSCSLNISGAGTIDVSNKDSYEWVQKLKARGASWSISADGMYALDGSNINMREIFALFDRNQTVTAKIATSDATDNFFSGSAVATSFSADHPDNDASTFSVELEGLGDLTFAVT